MATPQLVLPSIDSAEMVYMCDAMAKIHKLEEKGFNNFNALVKQYMQRMVKSLKTAYTVINVFDQYKEDSVKEQ